MDFKIFQQVCCPTVDDLINFGKQFTQYIRPGEVCSLDGALGAGKTTFVKGIAWGYDISDEITSPTFNLMSMYSGSINLIHIDAYRLEPGERLDVFDFAVDPYVVFVEWADNLTEIQEYICWKIKFDIDLDGTRNLMIYKK